MTSAIIILGIGYLGFPQDWRYTLKKGYRGVYKGFRDQVLGFPKFRVVFCGPYNKDSSMCWVYIGVPLSREPTK